MKKDKKDKEGYYMKYEKPEMETLRLTLDDVIRTSGTGDEYPHPTPQGPW